MLQIYLKTKRDPTKQPDSIFQYLDISSIDVSIGAVSTPQLMEGSEAPSRARKVVRAFDIGINVQTNKRCHRCSAT